MKLRSVILSLAFLSAPAMAQYHAQPETRPAEARVIARELAWNCDDSGCVAGRSHSRPAIVCALLVREVGRLRSFSASGRAFGAEELEACNRRAR